MLSLIRKPFELTCLQKITWENMEVQSLPDSFAAREDSVVVLPTNTFYFLSYSSSTVLTIVRDFMSAMWAVWAFKTISITSFPCIFSSPHSKAEEKGMWLKVTFFSMAKMQSLSLWSSWHLTLEAPQMIQASYKILASKAGDTQCSKTNQSCL